MIPLGLCTLRRDGTSRSLAYLDVCLAHKEVSLPEKYETELEDYVRRVAPAVHADPRRRRINQLCYQGNQPVLCLAASTDGHKPASFIWISAWSEHTLEALLKDAVAQTDAQSLDDTDKGFLRRIRHLAFSILLFLSQMPFEYEPEVLRKERKEGDDLKPALLRARFVGASQVRPIRKTHTANRMTGRHLPSVAGPGNVNPAAQTGASAS
jgi:hypothetical protein